MSTSETTTDLSSSQFSSINGLPLDDRMRGDPSSYLSHDEDDDDWDLGNSGEPIFQEMALPFDSNQNAIREQQDQQQQQLFQLQDETDSPKISVFEWGEWDVPLLGRTQKALNHIGTRRYEALVAQHRSAYLRATSRAERNQISNSIYTQIRDQGGRFLIHKPVSAETDTTKSNNKRRLSAASQKWYEISKENALVKIADALFIQCSDVSDGLESEELQVSVPLPRASAASTNTSQEQAVPPTPIITSPAAVATLTKRAHAAAANDNEPTSPASATPTTASQAHLKNPVGIIKSVFSLALLVFSIVVVMALIFDQQTSLSEDTHPAVAFLLIWVSLLWLSLVEGGQASMVGLPPIDRQLYKESHPISYRICEHGHRGDNLDRYLIGRQFMVLALVFIINLSGAPIQDASVLNLPDVVSNAFLDSGLAMILMTCMIGQLNTQVNASHCMLDFINDWGNWFTVKVAMAIEASGLLHASYLIQILLFRLAGKTIESNEEPRDACQKTLFWGRVLLSCALLTFALVATIAALFEGKTTVWDGIPEAVALILFLFLMSIVGMLEGMQIAFFAVAKLTDEERNSSVWASRTCDLLFRGEGRNLPGFMVGRQLFVVACFFVIARVTSMDVEEGESNVLGVSDTAQEFFSTGLLGALITTILASIAWQLMASAFPLAFLSTPVTYLLLRICLLLEATGICNGAWVLAAIHKNVAGFQRDEVYVGTAEERLQAANPKTSPTRAEFGTLVGSAFPANHYLLPYYGGEPGASPTERRTKIHENIAVLQEQLERATTAEETQIYQAALRHENAALRQVVWR